LYIEKLFALHSKSNHFITYCNTLYSQRNVSVAAVFCRRTAVHSSLPHTAVWCSDGKWTPEAADRSRCNCSNDRRRFQETLDCSRYQHAL